MNRRQLDRVTRTVRVVRRAGAQEQPEGPFTGEPARAVGPRGRATRARWAGAPWLALCDEDAVEIRDPRVEDIRRVAPGTTVVLVCDEPLSRWRLRRLAARAGMAIERELIAVPHTRSPVVLLDETESAVTHFWSDVITVPPGLTLALVPASVVLRLARMLPWRWTGALAPGRVVIGRRS
ncbi:hypothetical protein ASG76_01965 [Nocardioides sp. Soil774]|uniref:hypothetical protein n=1 Tax=Nocardioides sp. Soil774 TaxID=1736408 RepID=UPI0007012D22|nr:hypothetical protein [Nocardioides sp. Soil774]KRE97505.1 hypothetical protein ASG76_01965 [Nocardioides sp. Soil774]